MKEALENDGFKVKTVINIINREKLPQPLFRVELEPGDIKLKKGEIHPIYNVKYLLYRRVTVEEPHKRNGPVQCLNCQEFGHTKSYCQLPAVCVVCAELHCSSSCNKQKSERDARKCSNCGEKHTANYRGCEVYSSEKEMFFNRKRSAPIQARNTQQSFGPQNALSTASGFQRQPIPQNILHNANNRSYANVVASQAQPQSQNFNFNRLEKTLDTLVQTINNFTNSMSNMMQEMMKMQSMLMQAILKNHE